MSGTWTFLQLVVSGPFPLSRPWPLVYTSLSKAILLLITRGYPGIFDMTKRVYLETIVISSPSNLSQDSAPADALMCWLLVGSKTHQWELIRVDRPLRTSNLREDDITATSRVLVLSTLSTTFPSIASHSPLSQYPCRNCLCDAAALSSSFHYHRLAP